MKTVLVIIIGVLLWQSPEARKFTSDALQQASDLIEPANTQPETIGEMIDSFLDWFYSPGDDSKLTTFPSYLTQTHVQRSDDRYAESCQQW